MSIVKRVKAAFDPHELENICEQPFEYFERFGVRHNLVMPEGEKPKPTERFYIHKDNGSDILFVAHLDTVQKDRRCSVVFSKTLGHIALSGALDDRLGAYLGLVLLPRMGITADWLLTTDEEIGQSTAANFKIPEGKHYRWMFEIDRKGDDVVLYKYDTPELRKLVTASGARVGNGSISDISYMGDLGISGVNWGCGYENYHTLRGNAELSTTFKMMARFIRFYNANAATDLPYIPRPVQVYNYPQHHTEWHEGMWDGRGRNYDHTGHATTDYYSAKHKEMGHWEWSGPVLNQTRVWVPRREPARITQGDLDLTAANKARNKIQKALNRVFGAVNIDTDLCPVCSGLLMKLDHTRNYCADCDLIPETAELHPDLDGFSISEDGDTTLIRATKLT